MCALAVGKQLPELKPTRYDDIINEITEILLNTKEIQRLKGVEQLGIKHYYFPWKRFSRYSHSICTERIAQIVTRVLSKKGYIDEEERVKISIAALIHDIGHGPFSHDSEPLMEKYFGLDHRKNGKRIVKESRIKDILGNYGYDWKEIWRYVEKRHPIISQTEPFVSGSDKYSYLSTDLEITRKEKLAKKAIKALPHCIKHTKMEDGKIVPEEGTSIDYFTFWNYVYHYMWKNVYLHPTYLKLREKFIEFVDEKIEKGEVNPEILPSGTDEELIHELGMKCKEEFSVFLHGLASQKCEAHA